MSAHLRAGYEATRLDDAQVAAVKWLGGLAERSGEGAGHRRGVVVGLPPRRADAGAARRGRRDGAEGSSGAMASGSSRSHRPSLAEEPDGNADIMAEFLNTKNGQTWQSIPVAVFYTKALEYLYHYTEYPAIYHKDQVVAQIRGARPGESKDDTQKRGDREFLELQQSPFFRVWSRAGADEILSALHERLVLGSPA